jgi:hypothetical protein
VKNPLAQPVATVHQPKQEQAKALPVLSEADKKQSLEAEAMKH